MSATRILQPQDINNSTIDYAKLKVGLQAIEDANILVQTSSKVNPQYGDKKKIQDAISKNDLKFLRDLSMYWFKISGIYSRLCKHLANFYRYDWYLTPVIMGKANNEDIIKSFNQNSYYLDEFNVKHYLGETALKIIQTGAYYGYIIHSPEGAWVQELPVNYCRVKYNRRNRPVVEMNMKFFDDQYKDPQQRLRILKTFPAEFAKGYVAYKEGRLRTEGAGNDSGWYLLDPDCAFKFSVNNDDAPPFISVIPHLIDLDAAQELDRKKMAQKLLKIIIQKMPLDKNGDLIFDIDEARELHNNAVKMLGRAIGIDVLTTFADVDVADLADKNTAAAMDELEKVERTVYNESGTAQNLFNTDGNIALEKSLLDDEGNVYNLLLQFEDFINMVITPYNKNKKKFFYRAKFLPTTVYNYKEMAKLYREQSQNGGSKVFAQIALGQSQSSVLALAKFENEILDVTSLFSSKQQLEENEAKKNIAQPQQPNQNNKDTVKKDAGRKEKPDDQKSEKTIKNKEAMN